MSVVRWLQAGVNGYVTVAARMVAILLRRLHCNNIHSVCNLLQCNGIRYELNRCATFTCNHHCLFLQRCTNVSGDGVYVHRVCILKGCCYVVIILAFDDKTMSYCGKLIWRTYGDVDTTPFLRRDHTCLRRRNDVVLRGTNTTSLRCRWYEVVSTSNLPLG